MVMCVCVCVCVTQNIFEKDVDSLSDPTKVGVLLCGQKDMCNAVTELCKKKGVAEIMLNF